MKFLEALSQQGEQQIKLHNFCESLRLNEEPLKIWLSGARPKSPLGVEAYARCYLMNRAFMKFQ